MKISMFHYWRSALNSNLDSVVIMFQMSEQVVHATNKCYGELLACQLKKSWSITGQLWGCGWIFHVASMRVYEDLVL